MNLPTMRDRVRTDLRDTTPADQRWTDAELDRHIARAVEEAGLAVPRELTVEFGSNGTRTIDLVPVSGLTGMEAVEYPVDQYPVEFVLFSQWGTKVTVLSRALPPAGETVRLYYRARHTLDASSSTLPVDLEDVVATGAAGYAALAWAEHAANRANTGGRDVWRNYQTLGQERLAAFSGELARRSRRGSLRARRLYRPADPDPSNQTAQF